MLSTPPLVCDLSSILKIFVQVQSMEVYPKAKIVIKRAGILKAFQNSFSD